VPTVRACPIPENAFLRRYLDTGAFADCYRISFDGHVHQSDYIAAFYTTRLFRLERLILHWAARRPSTDEEAVELGLGKRTHFAAWRVEAQDDDQLLLCDDTGRTRSWLMAVVQPGSGPMQTVLHFGSAVVPRKDSAGGAASPGFPFSALLGFHKLYSRLLLRAAHARLAMRTPDRAAGPSV